MSQYIQNIRIVSENYSAQPDDQYIGCLTQQRSINIQLANFNGVAEGATVIIKDDGGNASVNPVIITAGANAFIDSQQYQIINTNFGSMTLVKRGNGYAVSSDVGASGGTSGDGTILSYPTAELPSPSTYRVAKLLDDTKGLVYSNGSSWQPVPESKVFNVRDYGATGDGVTDDSPFINSAITSMSTVSFDANGGILYFPPGTYRLAAPIDVVRRCIIRSDYPNLNFTPPAYLKPDVGVTAIIIHYANDATTGVSNPDGGNGGGTQIENITIVGSPANSWSANRVTSIGDIVKPTTGSHYYLKCSAVNGDAKTGLVEPTWATTGPDGTVGTTIVDNHVTWKYFCQTGIWMRGVGHLNHVSVSDISGDGVQILGSTSDTPPTNTNGSSINQLFVADVNGSGLFVQGADASACLFQAVNVSGCGMWGVWDSSFLGNTHIAHEVAGAEAFGAYLSDDGNARNVFINCYSEGDCGPSRILAPGMMLGGIAAEAITADTDGLIISNSNNSVKTYMTFSNSSSTAKVTIGTGGYGVFELSPLTGAALPYGFRYGFARTGWWEMNYGNVPGGSAFAFNDQASSEDYGRFWIPNGFHIGTGSGYTVPGIFVNNGVAVPSSVTSNQGDFTFNRSSTNGSQIAWRCSSAGFPGTWETIYGQSVIPQPQNSTLTVTDTCGLYTNASSSGEVDLYLPPSSLGNCYLFSVEVSNLLKIIAHGSDVIRLGSSFSAAGGSLNSSTSGSSSTARCTSAGVWTVFGPSGTWSVT